ncbi:BRCT domain-containing protein [Parasitella parasitica]|nr:BRCT domain-containing protein [Parasitella parasitica]
MLGFYETLKLGRHINDKKSINLFEHVVYSIDDRLPKEQTQRLNNILFNNGGVSANQQLPNLFVSDVRKMPSIQSVTPLWVEKAIMNGFVHDMSYYEPGKHQFLSGQVLLLLDLPEECKEIHDQVLKFGGQCRDDFSEDVTCLICIEPRGVHYNECMERSIPVVLPQWLDDCLRYHHQFPYDSYRLPSPFIYYQNMPDPAAIYPYPKAPLVLAPNQDIAINKPLHNQVVYLGKDVRSDKEKEKIIPKIEWYIQEMGARILEDYNPHQVTVVILKYRSSIEYKQAVQDKKCIASFWWISNTYCRGYWCSPLDTLFDYPVPKVGMSSMQKCVIALTGFKAQYRSYVNILIAACGAKYSAELAKDTTHLICGGGSGDKYAKLHEHPSVELVNHLWLEDCYAQWRFIDIHSDRRYTYIPTDNALLEDTIAKAHLIPDIIDKWKDDLYEEEPQVVYEEYDVGFIEEIKPRKAALRAHMVLNEHIMPDANAYEKESKLYKK